MKTAEGQSGRHMQAMDLVPGMAHFHRWQHMSLTIGAIVLHITLAVPYYT